MSERIGRGRGLLELDVPAGGDANAARSRNQEGKKEMSGKAKQTKVRVGVKVRLEAMILRDQKLGIQLCCRRPSLEHTKAKGNSPVWRGEQTLLHAREQMRPPGIFCPKKKKQNDVEDGDMDSSSG